MAQEIERKFLLISDEWKSITHKKINMRQGYLCNNNQTSVRIRIEDLSANVNIKSMTTGVSRAEYEYAIPVDEAHEMLDTLCIEPKIKKERFLVNYAGKLWEIDVFAGDNAGLIVAEVELKNETEAIELPKWIGKEVSTLERYYNMRLSSYPYSAWSQAEKLGDQEAP